MTDLANALWMQNLPYDALTMRGLLTALWPDSGTVKGMAVVAATGMAVTVKEGMAAVAGTDMPDQGTYLCHLLNDTAVTIAAAPGSGTNRIDTIVAQVTDDAILGTGTPMWQLVAIAGTPAASPAPPALPLSCVPLANVRVNALVASIVAADITDRRNKIPRFQSGSTVVSLGSDASFRLTFPKPFLSQPYIVGTVGDNAVQPGGYIAWRIPTLTYVDGVGYKAGAAVGFGQTYLQGMYGPGNCRVNWIAFGEM